MYDRNVARDESPEVDPEATLSGAGCGQCIKHNRTACGRHQLTVLPQQEGGATLEVQHPRGREGRRSRFGHHCLRETQIMSSVSDFTVTFQYSSSSESPARTVLHQTMRTHEQPRATCKHV